MQFTEQTGLCQHPQVYAETACAYDTLAEGVLQQHIVMLLICVNASMYSWFVGTGCVYDTLAEGAMHHTWY